MDNLDGIIKKKLLKSGNHNEKSPTTRDCCEVYYTISTRDTIWDASPSDGDVKHPVLVNVGAQTVLEIFEKLLCSMIPGEHSIFTVDGKSIKELPGIFSSQVYIEITLIRIIRDEEKSLSLPELLSQVNDLKNKGNSYITDSLDLALKYYFDGISLLDSLENLEGNELIDVNYTLAILNLNISCAYLNSNNFEKSIEASQKALEIFKNQMPCRNGLIAKAYFRIGNAYEKRNMNDLALENYIKASKFKSSENIHEAIERIKKNSLEFNLTTAERNEK